nr:beta-1,4-mannosyl-glycoprotein 4-beta-n-acetylglucosaminyltransferase [Quercus suber]
MSRRTSSPARKVTNHHLGSRLWSRPYRTVAIVGIFLAFLLLVARRPTTSPFPYDRSSLLESKGKEISPTQISSICRHHGYSSFRSPSSQERKVYDLFLLSTELDWLEIRLHTLAKAVDYFVIVESPTTFTGMEKPLYLQDNWSRFAAFHHQIIHRIVQDPGSEVIGSRTWDHEDFMRNALFDHVFPTLVDTQQAAQLGDVLIVSDIDEIPKPGTVNALRYCGFPTRLTLRSRFYYYSFQWLHRGEQWAHPQATVYRGLEDTIKPKDLRNGEPATPGFLWLHILRSWWQKGEILDASWHCSSCFATVAEMKKKMSSFSHSGWNTETNRDAKTIVDRVRHGLDLFGRKEEVYDRVDKNQDLPQYILDQEQRFGYLVNRDGQNAGFSDIMASPPGGPAAAGAARS